MAITIRLSVRVYDQTFTKSRDYLIVPREGEYVEIENEWLNAVQSVSWLADGRVYVTLRPSMMHDPDPEEVAHLQALLRANGWEE